MCLVYVQVRKSICATFLRKIAMVRGRLNNKKNPHAEVIKLKNCKKITVFLVHSLCVFLFVPMLPKPAY